MSPRWLVAILCLILMMAPSPVSPQITIVITVLKTALCTVSSTVFILASCAPRERLLCRVIAFKLKLLCRTFPCTNYGAPSQRSCAILPLGCLPWNIRPLGLCQPFRVCCNKGGTFDPGNGMQKSFSHDNFAENQLSKLNDIRQNTTRGSALSFDPNPPTIEPKETEKSVGGNLVFNNSTSRANQTDFYIPTSAKEYMADWVETEDNPAIVEQTIKYQFDKFMKELEAINKQETEHGRETVRVPNFEEFRSVALGQAPLL